MQKIKIKMIIISNTLLSESEPALIISLIAVYVAGSAKFISDILIVQYFADLDLQSTNTHFPTKVKINNQ